MPRRPRRSSPRPPSRKSASSDRARPIDAWHKDLVAEYEALCDTVDRGEPTFLDPYAAEDEIEFFAVASEEFIECSGELRAAHPRRYSLLCEFYVINPAAWAALAAAKLLARAWPGEPRAAPGGAGQA